MKNQPEYELQVAVCDYLAAQYPNVLFLSDTVAQVKLTMPQAVRNKRIQKSGFKCPDLMIFEPRCGADRQCYAGLFIELKAESPHKRDGSLKKDAHLEAQAETIRQLVNKGYYALFVWSFEDAKKIIDSYLKG